MKYYTKYSLVYNKVEQAIPKVRYLKFVESEFRKRMFKNFGLLIPSESSLWSKRIQQTAYLLGRPDCFRQEKLSSVCSKGEFQCL